MFMGMVNVCLQPTVCLTPMMEISTDDVDELFALGRTTIVTKVDNTDVAACEDISEAVMASVALYWVFNVAFPKELKKTLSFIAGHICHLDPYKPSSCVQKILNKIL
jgi:hypothetical protein